MYIGPEDELGLNHAIEVVPSLGNFDGLFRRFAEFSFSSDWGHGTLSKMDQVTSSEYLVSLSLSISKRLKSLRLRIINIQKYINFVLIELLSGILYRAVHTYIFGKWHIFCNIVCPKSRLKVP